MKNKLVNPIIVSTLYKATNSEKVVIKYINSIYKTNFYLSQKELAKKTNTSEPTISRLTRKLGFKSYKDFAMYVNTQVRDLQQKYSLKDNDDISSIAKNIISSHQFSINSVINDNNILKINQLCEIIKTKKRVIVWGLGTSHNAAFELKANLSRIGINSIGFEDFHVMLPLVGNLSKDDLFICLSNNARSKEVKFLLKKANQNKATNILITSNQLMIHENYINLCIFYKRMSREGWFIPLSSKTSQTIICDLIFQIIIQLDPSYKNAITKSMKIMKEWETLAII